MKEIRVFLELVKMDDDTIYHTVGGFSNDGQMESFDDLESALEFLNNECKLANNHLTK